MKGAQVASFVTNIMEATWLLLGKSVNLSLDVLENAHQDHIVETGADQDDGKAFVHAGLRNSKGGLANFFGFSK